MIEQKIKYEDYNGNEQTESFWFHLTKLELMEMELHHPGGLSNYIEELNETTEGAEAYDLFKKIILEAHGRKSPDGRHFWKIDPDTGRKYADEFVSSPAMSELIFSFLEDANVASKFVTGLLPANLVAEVEAEAKAKRGTTGEATVTELPAGKPKAEEKKKEVTDFTREQLLEMSDEEFAEVAGTDPTKMDKEVLVLAMQRKSKK